MSTFTTSCVGCSGDHIFSSQNVGIDLGLVLDDTVNMFTGKRKKTN